MGDYRAANVSDRRSATRLARVVALACDDAGIPADKRDAIVAAVLAGLRENGWMVVAAR